MVTLMKKNSEKYSKILISTNSLEKELHPHECMFLDRKRRGENQTISARRLGISRWTYCRFENGEKEIPPELIPVIEEVKANEFCMILRRRFGWTQADAAHSMGVCRWWYNQMERGLVPYRQLVEYWKNEWNLDE